MKQVLPIVSILLILLTLNECSEKNARLIATHIVYRHGDRTPFVSYPKSTTGPHFWRNGLGQLTPRGQLQQIRLGQYFRKRYSELLNSTYVASEVTIRSADYDRALMSAYANLIGLYPTSSEKLNTILSQLGQNDEWPETIPWQPIPVHTTPRSIDYVMAVTECPRTGELFGEAGNSANMRLLMSRYRSFFDQIEIWTGTKINSVFDVSGIIDAIMVESFYDLQPSWANSSVLAQLQRINDLSYNHFFESPEMNRIMAGPMVRDIMENILNVIEKKTAARKAKIYSGLDIIMASLLSFLGTKVGQPRYCSTLFFDLYHIQEHDKYALKVEYLNPMKSNTVQSILLPPCSDLLCPLETLGKWLEGKLPSTDMDTECMAKNPK